jgi:KaiC/GvpD/RAD55 family RecA-like ATPase
VRDYDQAAEIGEMGGAFAPVESYAADVPANGHANGSSKPTTAARTDEVPAVRKLSGINFADMKPHLSDGQCIKGLFAKNSSAIIVGAAGSGKTFFATDLAVHQAANRSWRGLKVTPGLVVYFALEGAVSAENRFYAARHGGNFPANIPLKLARGPVNLRALGDIAMVIDFVREAEAEHGVKVVAVYVDTLSRAMSGGDENGSEDMGALVAGVDAIRLATGATVILVHHTGKDESRGARGHSSLRAAVDTEIEVAKTSNVHLATVTKQRDLPSGAQYPFALEVVELGRDTDGDVVSTCVVRIAESLTPDRKAPTGKNQASLLAALQEWQRVHPETSFISSLDYRAIAKTQGIPPKRLPEVTDGLVRFGWLTIAAGGYSFPGEPSP